ncbi:MAG TPA: FAD-dependent thymidylate synthase [Candidatus Paceibacterota bacterium]
MADFQPTARVIADSLSPLGIRLTTIEVKIHRFVLPEFNTHRVFSRNSASSRAIPARKLIEKVYSEDVVPLEWASEQPGMQGGNALDEEKQVEARSVWLAARNAAVEASQDLIELGVHKSIANRLVEPFAYQTIITTATDWDGFWEQRISPLAQPEIREAARAMRGVYMASEPRPVDYHGWHLPYVQPDEKHLHIAEQRRISAARCARVSYLTHDGKRDLGKDLQLFERLVGAHPRHYSPLEHVATPAERQTKGNLNMWYQLRHLEDMW